jgi:N12 class adenine-specific DNA methylase
MKCPFLLEPHQIQGLDFINIYPVVQWLVKESVNLRNEKAERLKLFAIGQFHNHFKLQSSDTTKTERIEVLKAVKRIEDLYALKRQFKRKLNSEPEDEKSRVRLTLLEYGIRSAVKSPSNAGEKSSKLEVESFSDEMNQEEVGCDWRLAFECAFDIFAWFPPSFPLFSFAFAD